METSENALEGISDVIVFLVGSSGNRTLQVVSVISLKKKYVPPIENAFRVYTGTRTV